MTHAISPPRLRGRFFLDLIRMLGRARTDRVADPFFFCWNRNIVVTSLLTEHDSSCALYGVQ